MPKGAALHTHHISLGSIKWIVANLTYWDNLYMRYDNTVDTLEFAWFQKSPKDIPGAINVYEILFRKIECRI